MQEKNSFASVKEYQEWVKANEKPRQVRKVKVKKEEDK